MLETDVLQFRGAFRFDALLRGLKVEAKKGQLVVRAAHGEARFALGEAARKWVERIQNPKGLLDKLGVTAEHVVAAEGVEDEPFRASLRERAGTVVEGPARKSLDAVFLGVEAAGGLARAKACLARLSPRGALWIVYPKGRKEVTESDVRRAGRALGLKDVKVVRFSETHTALKFVRPLAPAKGAPA